MNEKNAEHIKTTVYWTRDLYEQVKETAGRNHRSLNAELLVAAEEHIKRERMASNDRKL